MSAERTAAAPRGAERVRAACQDAAALGSGALLACAFAPLQWWPLALLCPAVLMFLWEGAAPRRAAWLGFLFNSGTFAAGTYWLYISIHVFGKAPLWIAVPLMLGLVAIMGVYHAALGYAVARWLPARGPLRWLAGIPGAWLLIEWWRGWFLSGFSWLSLGYSQTDTPLAGFAPVLGVYGISALLLLGAGALITLLRGGRRERLIAAAALALPWLAGAALRPIEWTQVAGAPVSVAILQGAIPQDEKWIEENREATLVRYRKLTEQALGSRLIVMPESALPELANELFPYIRELFFMARGRDSALVFGVLRATDEDHYFNSVMAIDLEGNVRWYDKQHLVPFAEFFPVPPLVRSWLRLLTLPYSDFTRGAQDQPPLAAGGLRLQAGVCYEDAYGSSMLGTLEQSDALVNVTNDAWFGHSSARHQHFQIARMRALEAGRYLIRAANDGVSAVIGAHGEVLARAPEFTPAVLRFSVVPRTGLPPYARVGNWLIVTLAAGVLAAALVKKRRSTGRSDI